MQAVISICHSRMGQCNSAERKGMLENPTFDMKANIQPKELSCKTCVQTKPTKQSAKRKYRENFAADDSKQGHIWSV